MRKKKEGLRDEEVGVVVEGEKEVCVGGVGWGCGGVEGGGGCGGEGGGGEGGGGGGVGSG